MLILWVTLWTWVGAGAISGGEAPGAVSFSILEGLDMNTWSYEDMPLLCDVDQALEALGVTQEECEILETEEGDMTVSLPVRALEVDGPATLILGYGEILGVYRLAKIELEIAVTRGEYEPAVDQVDALVRYIDTNTAQPGEFTDGVDTPKARMLKVKPTGGPNDGFTYKRAYGYPLRQEDMFTAQLDIEVTGAGSASRREPADYLISVIIRAHRILK